MFFWASLENHSDLLLRELAKRMKTKRNTNIDHSHYNYENAYSPTKNNSYGLKSMSTLKFELQGKAWDLSKMRISYKLTKRTKFARSFKTFSYKQTAS